MLKEKFGKILNKNTNEDIEIAFIGGSGLYKVPGLKKAKWLKIKSSFGKPSDEICVGFLNEKKVAFLPRHGRSHNLSPSKINFRANIECLKILNVKNIISLSAVGSLRKDYKPGNFVVINQFIDKTFKRESTFFDDDIVAHIPFAHPVCKNLSEKASKVLKKLKIKFHSTGTYVCIEGPQFSSLAESQLYRSWGCDVIGMTNMPEAKLAKEAGICYSSIAMVTDFDCWHPNHDKVTVDTIIKTLNDNSSKAFEFIKEFSLINSIKCVNIDQNLSKNSIITDLSKVDKKTKNKLRFIIQ